MRISCGMLQYSELKRKSVDRHPHTGTNRHVNYHQPHCNNTLSRCSHTSHSDSTQKSHYTNECDCPSERYMCRQKNATSVFSEFVVFWIVFSCCWICLCVVELWMIGRWAMAKPPMMIAQSDSKRLHLLRMRMSHLMRFFDVLNE